VERGDTGPGRDGYGPPWRGKRRARRNNGRDVPRDQGYGYPAAGPAGYGYGPAGAEADGHGYPADGHGYPADGHGYPADGHGYPADGHGYPADGGYLGSGSYAGADWPGARMGGAGRGDMAAPANDVYGRLLRRPGEMPPGQPPPHPPHPPYPGRPRVPPAPAPSPPPGRFPSRGGPGYPAGPPYRNGALAGGPAPADGPWHGDRRWGGPNGGPGRPEPLNRLPNGRRVGPGAGFQYRPGPAGAPGGAPSRPGPVPVQDRPGGWPPGAAQHPGFTVQPEPPGPVIRQREAAVPEGRPFGATQPAASIAPDGLEAFARDLRALRAKAGLDYTEMAEISHYTMKTLVSAAGGLRLPTLPVAVAYVRACGGDVAEWEERWQKLAAKITADAAKKPKNSGDGAPAQPAPVSRPAAPEPPAPDAAQQPDAGPGEVYVITSARPRHPGRLRRA